MPIKDEHCSIRIFLLTAAASRQPQLHADHSGIPGRVIANCITATSTPSQPVKTLPIEGSLNAVRQLLKMVYNTLTRPALAALLQQDRNTFKAVVRMAHKFDIPRVLWRMDAFLAESSGRHSQSILNARLSEVVAWTDLACRCSLTKFRARCERHLMHNALGLLKQEACAELPSDCLVRVFQGAFHALTTADVPTFTLRERCGYCGTEVQCSPEDATLTEDDLASMLEGGILPPVN